MGPIDTWWNKHFPAHSYARLAFLLVAAPIMGAFVMLLRAVAGMGEFTWGRYLTLAIASEVIITFAWVVARMRADEIDFEKGNEEFGTRDLPWQRRVPWEVPQEEPTSSPTGTPGVPDIILEAPKKPRMPALYDYALTLLVSFITFAILMEFFFDIGTTAENLGWAAIGGFGMSLVMTFRYSPLVPILLAIAIGYPAAVLPALFFSFLGGEESIWEWWAVMSVLAFVFLMPPWLMMRRLRGRWERFRIPNWAFTSVVSILMLLAIGFSSVELESTEQPVATPASMRQRLDTVSDGRGTSSAEAASLTLYYAWRNGDRAAARRVAADAAVDHLFNQDYESTARFVGCGQNQYEVTECLVRRPGDQILMTLNSQTENRFYVDGIFFVGFDYPLDFSQPSPTSTPSPSETP